MSAPVLAEKRCTKCGQRLPLSEFYRNRAARDGRAYECKPCARARVRQWQADRREKIGVDAARAEQRIKGKRHRERTGNATGKKVSRVRYAATARLIEAHRAEFDRLMVLERDRIERQEEQR